MPKKIYVIAQSYIENRGSFSGFIELFAKFVSARGYKVIILCGQISKNEKKLEELSYAEVHRFPTIKLPFFGMIFNSLSLARQIKCYFKECPILSGDIILANGEAALGVLNQNYLLRAGDQPAFAFWKSMELAKKECPLISRLARLIHLWIQFFMEKVYIKAASSFIFSSQASRDLFIRYYGHDNKPYFIPRSGVRLVKLKKIKNRKINLLFIALNNERIRKGVVYLEKVLPEIFAKYKDVNLVHVGEKFDWNVPNWCKDRIASIGKVPWEKMKDYYAAADIIVSCSLSEGFPNTILEAMAAGLPVVTSDIEGVNEYITHLKEGYVYRRGDCGGLKKGICHLLKYPVNAKKMGQAASNRMKALSYPFYLKMLLAFMEDAAFREKSPYSVNLLRCQKMIKQKPVNFVKNDNKGF